jgi:hypothetical protein
VGAEVDAQDTALEDLPSSKVLSNEPRTTPHIQHVFECARSDVTEIFHQDLQSLSGNIARSDIAS